MYKAYTQTYNASFERSFYAVSNEALVEYGVVH